MWCHADLNTNQTWPGPVPIAAQQGIARYLTNLIQKKPSPGGCGLAGAGLLACLGLTSV